MNWNVFEIFLPFSSKITSRLVENESREYFDILTNNKFQDIKFVKMEIYQFLTYSFDCLQEFNFTISIFSLVFLSIVEACLGKKKKKERKIGRKKWMEHKLQSNEVGFVNNKDGLVKPNAFAQPRSAIGQRILFRNIFCPPTMRSRSSR